MGLPHRSHRSAPRQRGRRVGRSLDESALDRIRGYHATEAYKKAMRKRKVWVEPLFAEAKAWHGLRRFHLRGLENVNCEALYGLISWTSIDSGSEPKLGAPSRPGR
jgi:DDE family transposase